MLREHGITKELSVNLNRDFKVEALSFLNSGRSSQSAQVQRQIKQTRRASVAGSNVFVVEGLIRETGFDHLNRIPRSKNVQIGQSDSTATTNNFSLRIGNRGNRPTCPTDELPLTDPTDSTAATVESGNTMKSAESAIMGAREIDSMESFHSLARRNYCETGETQHAQSIHLNYRSNCESDAFEPSNESVNANSLFENSDDADSSLDEAREVDIFDDVDDLGLNGLFIESSESISLFYEEGSSTSNDIFVDSLSEEKCKC